MTNTSTPMIGSSPTTTVGVRQAVWVHTAQPRPWAIRSRFAAAVDRMRDDIELSRELGAAPDIEQLLAMLQGSADHSAQQPETEHRRPGWASVDAT